MNNIKRNSAALISGITFGIGLALSGMTDSNKVQGFLDVFGQWDGSLMLVMASALVTTFITFRFLLKRKSPILDKKFFLPIKKSLDKPLMAGAMLFGIGWGLVGYCPGPAIAALSHLQWQPLVFVVSMFVGSLFAKQIK